MFNQEQRDDFGWLLARYLPCGNISWLATTVLGADGGKQGANEVGDIDSFARAIVQALHEKNCLREAVELLRQHAHPNSPLIVGLRKISAGERLQNDAALQALLDEHEPFLSSADMVELLPRVLRTVCAVGLGMPYNKIVGSGFLIAPDLVMTNYHVLQNYLLPGPPAQKNALGRDLYFIFDYLLQPPPRIPKNGQSHSCHIVNAADDWLVDASQILADDGMVYPNEPTTNLDYVVIRLAKRVGAMPGRNSGGARRGWLPLPDAPIDVLGGRHRLLLFQHPAGQPQQCDVGRFERLDPTTTRIWYSLNAAKGSSGAPAVDSSGRLFALHNAEVRCAQLPDGTKYNQGVRIDRIAQHLATRLGSPLEAFVQEEALSSFWSLSDDINNPRPVIGRMRFRKFVANMTKAAPDSRVLVVTGPMGSGLQYSAKLLRRCVGAQVPVVEFSPKDLEQLGARDFLRVLANELRLPNALAASIPAQPSTENVSRWLRTDLPCWLAQRLTDDEQRNKSKYPAWVVINAVVPGGQRLLWADTLKDFVAALAGASDPGQPTIELPQLRWLFLAPNESVNLLPTSGLNSLEDNVEVDSAYDNDFAKCVELAWRSIDRLAGDQNVPLLSGVADGFLSQPGFNPSAVPVRKMLAQIIAHTIKREIARRGPP